MLVELIAASCIWINSRRSPAAIGVVDPEPAPSVTCTDPAAKVPNAGVKYVFKVPVRLVPAPSRPGVAHKIGCTTVTALAVLLLELESEV